MKKVNYTAQVGPGLIEVFHPLTGERTRIHDSLRDSRGSLIYFPGWNDGFIRIPKAGHMLELFAFAIFGIAALSEIVLSLLGGG